MEHARDITPEEIVLDNDVWERVRPLDANAQVKAAPVFRKKPLNPARPVVRKPIGKSAKSFDTLFRKTDVVESVSNTSDISWASLNQVGQREDTKKKRRNTIISNDRNDPVSGNFDLLRTRLVQKLSEHDWKRIAVISPTSGCGATFTAANLAVSLSRLDDYKTILIDANLRAPNVALAMGVRSEVSTRQFFTGQADASDYLVKYSENLALGLSEEPEDDAAEIAHSQRTKEALLGLQTAYKPDVTIFDLPPLLSHDDASAYLRNVDGVLLVASAVSTTKRQIVECERAISDQSQFLGVILNRSAESRAVRGRK